MFSVFFFPLILQYLCILFEGKKYHQYQCAQVENCVSIGVPPKPDKLSLCWELLLRIDSMVLSGMISAGEASDFRRLVMDHKVIVADAFNEILQKKDAELLSELLHFSDRSKKYNCLLDVATFFFLNS